MAFLGGVSDIHVLYWRMKDTSDEDSDVVTGYGRLVATLAFLDSMLSIIDFTVTGDRFT